MARAHPVEIGAVKFAKKGDALIRLKSILNNYGIEERVSLEDQAFLSDALKNHPDARSKVGVGIAYIFVRRADYSTRCFWVKRLDGSEERFSYKSCV